MNKNYIEKANVEELIDKLQKYDISLNKEVIKIQYANCYNLKQVVESYKLRYENECQRLDKLNKSITSDYIEYVVDKIVKENYDTTTLPDPYYIYKEIKELAYCESLTKLKHCLNRLFYMNDLNHLNSLVPYFNEIDSEIGTRFFEIFDNFQLIKLNKNETGEYISLLDNYLISFDQDIELNKEVALIQLERIASLGNPDEIDEAIIRIKKTYYVSVFSIYAKVLLGILDSDKKELFDSYYKRSKQYMAMSAEDVNMQTFIENLYTEVKENRSDKVN